MNTALEYSTRVVQDGGRRCKKSTLNDLVHLTPLRIPLMNPPIYYPHSTTASKPKPACGPCLFLAWNHQGGRIHCVFYLLNIFFVLSASKELESLRLIHFTFTYFISKILMSLLALTPPPLQAVKGSSCTFVGGGGERLMIFSEILFLQP
jgi:hypothetical protein